MFRNPLAVVIGAGSGMGAAVARRLRASGHDLLLADLREDSLRGLANELGAETAAVDISDDTAVQALASRATAGVQSLVVSAGLSASMASFERIIDVNLGGSTRVLNAFASVMNSGGSAVLFSSIAGHVPGTVSDETEAALRASREPSLGARVLATLPSEMRVTGVAYALSKYGVLRLMERTAVEWGKRGLRICSVSPGLIDTPMGRLESEANGDAVAAALAAAPIPRRGTADEVAGVVSFLCSPAASFMTGCDLVVDGGWLASMRAATGDALGGVLAKARNK